ncbi:MAG: Lrp/AsnC family transcriptional regulator [Candidatus Dormibacteria bacterium]
MPRTRQNSPELDSRLDATDVELLRHLQSEPRISIAELGRRVGMSPPPVRERVERLELLGVIVGYEAVIDPAALGLPLAAFVQVRPAPGQLNQVATLARSLPEVVEAHRITGEDCFLLRVQVASMAALEGLLDQLLAHGQTSTSLLQSSPVPRRGLPLPEAASLTKSRRRRARGSAKVHLRS